MSTRLTVVICTYNPQVDYLNRTLAGLRAQSLPTSDWELILVDNASAEPVAGRFDLAWHPRGRIVEEPNRGKTHAVVRGINEAAGEVIVFVDDDNILDPDYLKIAIDMGDRRPWLGAWGSGAIVPEFEEPPAKALKPYLMFALRQYDQEHWSNSVDDWPATPLGAGLCIRREIATHWVTSTDPGSLFMFSQIERTKGEFVGSEDIFLALHPRHFGLGWGTTPELKIIHLIAAKRVRKDYLVSITEGYAVQYVIARKMMGRKITKPMTLRKRLAKSVELMTDRRFIELEFLRARDRGVRRGRQLIEP